jgi:hypothetical protein
MRQYVGVFVIAILLALGVGYMAKTAINASFNKVDAAFDKANRR